MAFYGSEDELAGTTDTDSCSLPKISRRFGYFVF